MSEFKVPVKVWISGPTYRVLAEHASKRNLLGVGELLEQVSEKLLAPSKPARRSWVRVTPDILNQIVMLHESGKNLREIHEATGVSISTVHAKLKALGLAKGRS